MKKSITLFLMSFLCIDLSLASTTQNEDMSLYDIKDDKSVTSTKQLMFIRHGNYTQIPGIYNNESDDSLSEKGKQQVNRLKPFLKAFNPDVIVSSSVLRCRQTTEILISENNINIAPCYDDRFRERVFPSLYNLTFDEIKKRYGQKKFSLLQEESEKLDLEGEETIEEAKKRVVTALGEYLQITKSRIAIISHGGPHSWLLCEIFNLENKYIRHFTLGEARLSLLEFNNDGSPSSIISINASDEPDFYLNKNE